MAFSHYRAAWSLPVDCATDRLVLLAIVEHADKDGKCWPSQARLAERTVLTDRTIRTALKRLESRGYIRRARRGTVAGRISDMFTLRLQPEAVSGCDEGQEESTSVAKRKQVPPEPGNDFRGNKSPIKSIPNISKIRGQQEDVQLRDRLARLLSGTVDVKAIGIRNSSWLASKLAQGACSEMIEHVALSVAMRGERDKRPNSLRAWTELEGYFEECLSDTYGDIGDPSYWKPLRDFAVKAYTSRKG